VTILGGTCPLRETIVPGPQDSGTGIHRVHYRAAEGETANLRRNHGAIEIDLKKGEEAILYSGHAPPSFNVAPLPLPGDRINAWGLKK
jgi:hypothetical protein